MRCSALFARRLPHRLAAIRSSLPSTTWAAWTPPNSASALRPYLLDHVVQRRMRPVRFVLCCTDDEYRDLQMNTLAPAHIVNVGPFPAAEFTSLLRDYMLCRGVPRARLPPPLPSPQQDFRPEMLEKAYELLKELGTIGN